MKDAMMRAEVGDDVLGDDPTVLLFERRMAELLGKEEALYVVSGTMANLLAVISQTKPGDEVLLDRNSHIFNYEAAGSAVIGGLQLHPFDGIGGFLPVDELPSAVRPDNFHYPHTSLVCVENTHNRGGGAIYPFDAMKEVSSFAAEYNLRLHLDGARLANAVVATGIPFSEWAELADSVNICFSKGLGAPVGSVLVSDAETIKRARDWRKRLGGGWRQAGLLAAACLYAIDNNVERLAEDHTKASRIAEVIEADPRFKLVYQIETNIVIFEVVDDSIVIDDFIDKLALEGVLCLHFGGRKIRMVTHMDISFDDINYFEKTFSGI
ncbi:aminotransferase class I/II-fold pyridoxal phosphate-dependent enzyme [bacterium]|nr:aminotransferase class I/II-fold pyridoxal phosphate-dependent enzyme [bacterium]